MEEMRKIVVIGGGAAGMVAALAAAGVGGARVLVLERMSRVGLNFSCPHRAVDMKMNRVRNVNFKIGVFVRL